MIRECKLCHKQVDFSESWCDHETMEESGWLDIQSRMGKATAIVEFSDDFIEQLAIDLGKAAAKEFDARYRLNYLL